MEQTKSRGGLFSLIFKFLAKFWAKIFSFFVKMIKFLKLGKFAFAAASFASYAYMFSWKFSLMIMFMLFVHESGHIWAMKRVGMKTKGIYFIPFVGGAAVADDEFPSRKAEAFVAVMGPIWGFVLALIACAVYVLTKDPMYAAVSSWMALINLINLLPIMPLDGGRIMKSIAYSIDSKVGLVFLIVALVASVIISIATGLVLFALLTIVGALDLWVEYKKRVERDPMYGIQILDSACVYTLTLLVLLGLMVYMQGIPGAQHALDVLKS